MFRKGPKYVQGEKWYAGSKCNGYKKGQILEILNIIGSGKKKKLYVTDKDENLSVISYKTLWKKCKKPQRTELVY